MKSKYMDTLYRKTLFNTVAYRLKDLAERTASA
jgi:hypothetical protein